MRDIVLSFNPDTIIHLAARTDLDEKRNIQGYAVNIQGVENLIDSIVQCSTVEKCIFTSSQLVCRVGYIPRDYKDYQPNTLYGESKVLTEKIVRQRDGGGIDWCLVRPTTVWGPGMSPHYQRFFKMVAQAKYFHVSSRPLYKSYSYIGNITYQYLKLIDVESENFHRRTFYLADYEPISLRDWVNTIQTELGSRPIFTCPEGIARLAARFGDTLNYMGLKSFPFNSFRLNNILTEYVFDLADTKAVCGDLPYTIQDGVKETVAWLKSYGITSS